MPIPVDRRIVAFHQDDESLWVADLECGHGQHVRHDPPWQTRAWVITPEGRAAFIGLLLRCVKCATEGPDAPIVSLEEQLRDAQLASDTASLARLISADLLFTGPDGRLYSKADDIAAHEGGTIRITKHDPVDLRIRRVGNDVAIVALCTQLGGSFGGTPFDDLVRYTRVWARESGGDWQVVAGHVSILSS